MKKTLLTLFTMCTVFQFTNAQLTIDTNSTCNKSTLVIASNIYHPTYDRFDNTKNKAYYNFVATSTNAKLIVKSKVFIYYVWVDSLCTFNNMGIYQGGYYKGVYSVNIPLENLKIGKKYFYQIGKYDSGNFESGILNISQPEDLPKNPKTITSNFPFDFLIGNYTKGREGLFSCNTTKADSNTIDLFVKFSATSTSATLTLNLDNANLESSLGIISNNYVADCKPFKKNTNLRTDTFTGLTIGTDYTVRIEIGGDAALGYARKSSANNASITLVGGTVTGLENDIQPTFSIAPNPSNGSFTFVSDNNADLVVYDLLGTKVAEFKNVSSNQNIDLQLEKGIYLLNVATEKGSKVEKLVIE